jgi:hypothetical protein
MKAKPRISLIVCCALIQPAGYAFVSDPAAQQGASNARTSTKNHLKNDERTTPLIEAENHGTASHGLTHDKSMSDKIPLPMRATKVRARRSKVVRNNSQGFNSRNPVHDPQPSSIKPIPAGKAMTHNSPIHPVAGSTIGGGNFRNRHLMPIPEGVGGPARTTRNASTLSGTGMGRRRAN